ncbi:protein mono-ADP-ribosyltransferase PARP14-like isoform X2 [Myripristis murdjan]|uniref:protein mono-ADP-ribosyltransferase PARP14-like isoform X2 n=1 Tax=Myripristis murdjan TaxID=586833 RepID=UPI001176253D|nr:protein mono-ADP-ribosyltransferase PARP14-like isoform X2 [Myripristis murdjan]
MDDPFKHHVYFECPSLDEEQKKKVETYFLIRRRSGGGECGPLRKVNDKVYTIAFKDEKDQQRVLQKSEHVLELATGLLALTIHDDPGLQSSSHTTTSTSSRFVHPDLRSTAPAQSHLPIHASTLTPCGVEHELQLDTYLIRYLKEHPRAGKELDEELASVASSVQLHPDEGRVLVKGFIPDMDEVQQWKAKIEKVFERIKKRYLCHFEVDPHKVSILLRSRSSSQDTDEVRVYSQVGVAVVVGEHSQVQTRLKDVVGLHVTGQGSGVSQKQTTTRRLGEAKLRLLWQDIEHSLRQDIPGVKVTQGDAGQLVLEGSVEEIVKAGDIVSKKENLILERMVPRVCPHLLAFLRKEYGGVGVLVKFLGVGSNVEIELRDTELRLFSLCSDKLDETEKALLDKFKEEKTDVPDCSAVPSELKEKLESKAKEMNQGRCKVWVRFISGSKVCLLGHTKEVEELSEVIIQFILDHSSVEGRISLPFSEIVDSLPELMQLHGVDHSEVTCHPVASSPTPMVVLIGPSSRVTQVRNSLGPLLDSLVQKTVTIDLPGALPYFQSFPGKEKLLSVGHSQKCLIQFQKPEKIKESGVGLSQGITIVDRYCLDSGLQVLVCQGDITEEHADALVNAANEDLNHGGGVAAALSRAGGPQVQKESSTLVKQVGKIRTGEVVVTTGGNLNCKKLLHAVGPVQGKAGGRERELLEKAVWSALNLAEMMEFQSIAIPCISSGIYGVPIRVCTEAIVTAVKLFGRQGRGLNKVILIDNQGEVVRAMQEACNRLLQGKNTGNSTIRVDSFQSGPSAATQDPVRGATAGSAGDGVQVEIVQGLIEIQQTDALVSPMVGHDPLSTRVGHSLHNVVGPQLVTGFNKEAGGATLAADIIPVEGLPGLPCGCVLFLNLLPWDNRQGIAIKALRQGIGNILAFCDNRGFSSVAVPALGTGAVLHFPHAVVARALLEEIQAYEQNRTRRTPFMVRIIIHPNDKESTKAFQSAQEVVHLRGFVNSANPDQASFYRHVSSSQDEVSAMLGRVKLQLVCGDIIHETTDVIVNTTDFSNNQSGVSKAILTAAGPSIQAELTKVGIPSDFMCTTGPGALRCKEIFHASFKREAQRIRRICAKILKDCESKGYHSAAFPAINTGAAGMDFDSASKAMLDGMASAVRDLNPNVLSLIRIVILQRPVFLAFRSVLENRFGLIAPRLTLREKAKQVLRKFQERAFSHAQAPPTPHGSTFDSWKPPPAVLCVTGCSSEAITAVQADLVAVLQQQLTEREVDWQEFSRLNDMELEAVRAKARIRSVRTEVRRGQSEESGDLTKAWAGNRQESGSGGKVYVLKGLKEDVLSVGELVDRALKRVLHADLQEKKEAMAALCVQWSMLDQHGVWQELSLNANYLLEETHLAKKVCVDVEEPVGIKVRVNLTTMEATDWRTGLTYKVKRNETATLELPQHWEPMAEETFKRVELRPDSQEYQEVAMGFQKTAKQYNIHKIERVQNYSLWLAYALCRQRILTKNGSADLGEKMLYHGTAAESCTIIEKSKFDRNFAGEHGAVYGRGVYFAVEAQYSARGYSPRDSSGLKRLYRARVLTGRYTVGNLSMKAPPPRSATDPTDCFDSLVDNQQQPSMFVIFHDDQAYPEYRITFS